MRTFAAYFALLIGLLGLACRSGGGGQPTSTATTEQVPTARQIIERSDVAMNQLRSARVAIEVRPAAGPDLNASWQEFDEFVAPDRAHYFMATLAGEFQRQTIVAGKDTWTREDRNGAWTPSSGGSPFVWPDFHRLEPRLQLNNEPLPVEEPRILREENVGGVPAWVVGYSYQEPSIEGPFTVFVTEWIAQETYYLLRHEHYDDDPFGVQARVTEVYSDFNVPIVIEPPG